MDFKIFIPKQLLSGFHPGNRMLLSQGSLGPRINDPFKTVTERFFEHRGLRSRARAAGNFTTITIIWGI